MRSDFHGPVRKLINLLYNLLYNQLGDPNGTFLSDFQSHGFHGRLLEISCFAYLKHAGLVLDRTFDRPDFIAHKGAATVAIEVTTTNPADNADRDVSVLRMENLSEAEVFERASIDFPKRTVRSLTKKLRHRYHELPHVAGHPLVVVVAPFYEAGSNFFVDESLIPSLYEVEDEAPVTPFFTRPDAAAISAVLYCNAFTVSRFWRLADPDWTAANFITERSGYGLFDTRPGILEFTYRLGHRATPRETWSEGVTLFLNPNATTPLPEGMLPASSVFALEGRDIVRTVRGFHPLASSQRFCQRPTSA
ncbi:MAG: hypothetical protein EOP84_05810 [Verrucomicrobiaceae bacterium]|nr:MAG: hypothetical protein EOP84_05810 [Verrucomicrobiaceae bacterium]